MTDLEIFELIVDIQKCREYLLDGEDVQEALDIFIELLKEEFSMNRKRVIKVIRYSVKEFDDESLYGFMRESLI